MEREFKEVLIEFLINEKITQKEFAERIGVKPSQVSEWLRGKAKPGYDNLKKIVEVFKFSAEYFLGLSETY